MLGDGEVPRLRCKTSDCEESSTDRNRREWVTGRSCFVRVYPAAYLARTPPLGYRFTARKEQTRWLIVRAGDACPYFFEPRSFTVVLFQFCSFLGPFVAFLQALNLPVRQEWKVSQ